MARELLILRHGKSDWRVDTDDFHRPLRKRGKTSVVKIAEWIKKRKIVPDYIISSPAVRAADTARRLCMALGLEKSGFDTSEFIYEASVEHLLAVLADCPEDSKRVALVGHNPGLVELLLHLVPTPPMVPENGKLMPTAALAHLLMPDDWTYVSQGSARLLHLTRPSAL